MSDKSLYECLGGYQAIAVVTDALMVRIKDDGKLRRCLVRTTRPRQATDLTFPLECQPTSLGIHQAIGAGTDHIDDIHSDVYFRAGHPA